MQENFGSLVKRKSFWFKDRPKNHEIYIYCKPPNHRKSQEIKRARE